jgi:hypothetical protein
VAWFTDVKPVFKKLLQLQEKGIKNSIDYNQPSIDESKKRLHYYCVGGLIFANCEG